MMTSLVRHACNDHFYTLTAWVEEERRDLLLWLSQIDYESHHEDLRTGILPDSGQWLIQSQEFVEWSQSSASSILWLHGIRE